MVFNYKVENRRLTQRNHACNICLVYLHTNPKTKGAHTMTHINFIAACGERLIDVGIALENEAIRAALVAGDEALVISLLDSEF